MSKSLRIVYCIIILLLFGVAGILGGLCIHYDRLPEGIIIIGSAVVILVVSIVVALSGSISKDETNVAKQKVNSTSVPKNAKILMTMNGTVQIYKNGKVTSDVFESVVTLYDGAGIYVKIDNKSKLLAYDDIEDIYKETDDDFFICMPRGLEYKFEAKSSMKLMALEEILNKQTDYRFDDGEE